MILQIIIEPYLEWAIAAALNLGHFVNTNSSDKFANYLSIVSALLCFVLIPTLMMELYWVPLKKFRSNKYKDKWGVMFHDIRSRNRYHI
jgi:hypothetical protein